MSLPVASAAPAYSFDPESAQPFVRMRPIDPGGERSFPHVAAAFDQKPAPVVALKLARRFVKSHSRAAAQFAQVARLTAEPFAKLADYATVKDGAAGASAYVNLTIGASADVPPGPVAVTVA